MTTRDEELEGLRSQNRELAETLGAIQSGETDAVVVTRGGRVQVYTLEGADHPYRVLVENIQEGALTLAVDGTILYANRGFAALSRLPPGAILGTQLRDQVAPADRDRFDDLLRRSCHHPERCELQICSGAGKVPALVSMTPITVGESPRISVVVSDRKEDYERLRMQGRMLDAVADAVVATDPEGRVVYWNDSASRLYGWEAGEVLGRCLDEVVDRVMPEDRTRGTGARPAGGASWSGEYMARRRDGSLVPVLGTEAPVYDEDGRLVGVVGASHDISERHRDELALAEYAARLRKTNTDLRRSNEELQRFAYVASHDLQEPLRSIVSFSELLERRYKGRLDQDADEYIAFIVEGGIRMQTLIRDLLQFSRVGTHAGPPCPVDTGATVADVLRSLAAPIDESGATVEVGDLPAVMADPVQAELVFLNLIANAVKYRQPERPLLVRVSGRGENGWCEFAVADNGIGIEAEYFDRIFEMFRRLHTTEVYPGTGIGLAVVKKVVERHGGRVRVESVPGEGSTFYFTLPAA